MKSIVQRALILCALLFASAAVRAQGTTDTIALGRMGFSMDSAFAATLENQSFHYAVAGFAKATATGAPGYKVLSGNMDEASGYGEIVTAGELVYNLGSLVLDLRNLTYENAPNGIYLTAAVFQNGAFQGREIICDFISGNVFGPFTVGTISTFNSYFVFDPAFAQQFMNFFQVPQLAGTFDGTVLGFVSFDLVLQASPDLKN